MQKGFTLVELSIVLVIIGLLIGGILVGQSLIDSAKINRLVSDIRQYEVAINGFKSKFKFYPGDSAYFTPPGRGDGDLRNGGTSGVAVCSPINPTLSNFERYQVWGHLAQAQMISENYVPYSPDMCGGTHSDDYNLAANQVLISPLIELDSKAMTHPFEGAQKMYPIQANKQFPADNFSLFFYAKPVDTLALENKLSAVDYVDEKHTGLVNYNGLGNCEDITPSPVLCTDSAALVGYVGYYLPPL